MSGTQHDRRGSYGFDDLGGVVADHHGTHVTVTFFYGDRTHDDDPYTELTIDGGNDNWASVRLTNANECRRLRNLLANAERRFR